MNEGPFPEHYEPFETPLGVNLMCPTNPKAISNPAARVYKGDMEAFGKGEAVLVVEDNSDVRQVAVSTLKSLGFTVTETETADAAADLLKNSCDFKLVLSDVRMPGKLNGADLAGLIRQKYPDVRVLLTTGYVEDAELIEEIDLLYKPYRAADLAHKIQSMAPHPAPASP